MSPRIPAEWEPHERTLIGWPCRRSSWGDTLERGRDEFASVANALVAFEPVTMVCADAAQASDAARRLDARVEIVIHPMDGSWLRDNGPMFVERAGTREAVHFRFNAWGERHAERDRDARLGATLARMLGDPVVSVDVVLEGGAVAFDGAGTMVVPEGCVMHPSRNWHLDRDQVQTAFERHLGVDTVIWIPRGLGDDLERDPERMYYGTDGHVDLFLDFIGPRRCLMLVVDEEHPDHAHLAQARAILEEQGIEVVPFPHMGEFEEDGRRFIAPYLNFYVANGAVLVPVSGAEPDRDAQAVAAIGSHWPGREVIPIPMRAGPMQGGAIHCLTRQVPRVGPAGEVRAT